MKKNITGEGLLLVIQTFVIHHDGTWAVEHQRLEGCSFMVKAGECMYLLTCLHV